MIRAVAFDVGETLVDESRQWTSLAAALGLPAFTLLAAVGGMIATGQSLAQAVTLAAPDADLRALRQEYRIEPRDLYPDALSCLAAVRALGLRLAIAGNQPRGAGEALRDCGITADVIATSAEWGVAKPDTAFFACIADALALPAAQILYVGDRLDNDVLPARAAGMQAVHLRRGPWALLERTPLPADVPSIATLDALLAFLPRFD